MVPADGPSHWRPAFAWWSAGSPHEPSLTIVQVLFSTEKLGWIQLWRLCKTLLRTWKVSSCIADWDSPGWRATKRERHGPASVTPASRGRCPGEGPPARGELVRCSGGGARGRLALWSARPREVGRPGRVSRGVPITGALYPRSVYDSA